ncbi:MAG TPA: helix-turn-helix transcriptional regulator [Candidatus Acidoferrum sp.]|nr:helix-turn-helix transcriptional regulator [Candidatus Acidoferrum sp.]
MTLRRERERSGLSVRQLADKAGLVGSTVSRLESGLIASPRPDHLQRIARALQIDVEELYADAGYAISGELPELATYLRRKFQLTPDEANRVEGYVQAMTEDNQPKEGSDDDKRDQAP